MADDTTNVQAYQQTPTPHPDLKSLDQLVGTWNVSDPSGAGAVQETVTYEWMDGGFFLLQHVDLEQDGQKVKGLEIIGHLRPFGEEPSADIHSRYYNTLGNTLDYVYEVAGDILTIWSGMKSSPAYFKGTFSDDGTTLTGAWVYPGGGGYESTATKVK